MGEGRERQRERERGLRGGRDRGRDWARGVEGWVKRISVVTKAKG